MESRNLLIEMSWQLVHLVLIDLSLSVVPELDLSEDLVGERVGHDE